MGRTWPSCVGLILTDLTHKPRCNQRSGCIELTVPHVNLRFCTNFRFADLAMICLVHDVFANSVSLFASEFSTGHHAFDDIPLRKAGLTSGVSKNKRLKGSIQGLVEDVQGAESSHLTAFPPGCQHHGNHFFDLSLSDFVVYGLSLVKFASDISWYFWDFIATLWSTLCLQELLAVQKAQQAASSDFEDPPPNCGHIERMWHEHRQWVIPFPSSRKSTQRRRCRRLSRRGWYESFVFGCLTPNTRIAWSRSGDKRWLTWPVPWFAPRGRGVVNYQVP